MLLPGHALSYMLLIDSHSCPSGEYVAVEKVEAVYKKNLLLEQVGQGGNNFRARRGWAERQTRKACCLHNRRAGERMKRGEDRMKVAEAPLSHHQVQVQLQPPSSLEHAQIVWFWLSTQLCRQMAP